MFSAKLVFSALLCAGLASWVYQSSHMPSRQMHAQIDMEDVAAAQRVFEGFDFEAAAARLAKALRIRTVSHVPGQVSYPDNFRQLHELLQTSYPLTHQALQRELINDFTLFYTWRGSDPELEPILLLSHLDVVPAGEHDRDRWSYEPFAGHIIDGYIYGRGSTDDKLGVLSIMEAVEVLVTNAFQPTRTIYIAFGHDEEVGGYNGAKLVADMLLKRGQRLYMVLDEGGALIENAMEGLDMPLATICVAEKGYVSMELTVLGDGGHSMSPPVPQTPIGIMAHALARLEDNQVPQRFTALDLMMPFIGPHTGVVQRLFYNNKWLLGGIMLKVMGSKATGNALTRTVTSPTMLNASVKENVLPTKVTAVVNFRLIPGDTLKLVMQHVLDTVADDRVKVSVRESDDVTSEPSPVSPVDAPQFQVLQRTITELFPRFVVTPAVTLGMTDSRHFHVVSDHVYRFLPFLTNPVDMKRIHGINERVSLKDSENSIRFYYQLIRNIDNVRK